LLQSAWSEPLFRWCSKNSRWTVPWGHRSRQAPGCQEGLVRNLKRCVKQRPTATKSLMVGQPHQVVWASVLISLIRFLMRFWMLTPSASRCFLKGRPQSWHKRFVLNLDWHHQSRHAPESRFARCVTCKSLAGIETQMGSQGVPVLSPRCARHKASVCCQVHCSHVLHPAQHAHTVGAMTCLLKQAYSIPFCFRNYLS